ncbi:hypothetical protein [Mesobacterium pallidum]|uniref:hypothetical protein n=1 Tax=Mesobacterium pallidum TaxID=2872037 RepID=UPI001EE1CC70|nr:hypothetical protein [Mesobacterium pallidum]
MSVIRTFFLHLLALSALLAVLVAPSNASAMISCLETKHLQHAVGIDASDHHGFHDVSDEQTDQQMSHCQNHACTAGVFHLPAQAPYELLIKLLDNSWDASSLMSMPAPEGLRRPPRV